MRTHTRKRAGARVCASEHACYCRQRHETTHTHTGWGLSANVYVFVCVLACVSYYSGIAKTQKSFLQYTHARVYIARTHAQPIQPND